MGGGTRTQHPRLGWSHRTGENGEKKYLKKQPPRISKINERHKSTDCRSSENPELENPAYYNVVTLNSKRFTSRETLELSRELCPTIHILDSLCTKIPALANLCPSDMSPQGKTDLKALILIHSNPSIFKGTVEKKIHMYDSLPAEASNINGNI